MLFSKMIAKIWHSSSAQKRDFIWPLASLPVLEHEWTYGISITVSIYKCSVSFLSNSSFKTLGGLTLKYFKRMKSNVITLTFFSCIIFASEISSQKDYSMPFHNPKSDHPLRKAWLLNAVLGLSGVVLNCIVLNHCMKEWKSLISSINAMIMYIKKAWKGILWASKIWIVMDWFRMT